MRVPYDRVAAIDVHKDMAAPRGALLYSRFSREEFGGYSCCLARCAERADAVESGAQPVLLGLQIVASLQVQPEPLGCTEVPG